MDFRRIFNASSSGGNVTQSVVNQVRVGNVNLGNVVRDVQNGNLGGLVNTGINEARRRAQVAAREEQQAETKFNNAQRRYDQAEDFYEREASRMNNNDAYLDIQQDRFDQAQQQYIEAYYERYGEVPEGLRTSQEIRDQYAPQNPQAAIDTVPMQQRNFTQTSLNQNPAEQVASSPDNIRREPAQATPAEAQPAQLNVADSNVLQAGLTLSGIDVGRIDGDVGKLTRAGMQEYVTQNPGRGLSVNDPQGIVNALREDMRSDPDMQSRMASIANDGTSANTNDVTAFQIALNDVDGAGLEVDGIIGTQSRQAFANHMDGTYDSAAEPKTMVADADDADNNTADQQHTFDQGTIKPLTPGGGTFA